METQYVILTTSLIDLLLINWFPVLALLTGGFCALWIAHQIAQKYAEGDPLSQRYARMMSTLGALVLFTITIAIQFALYSFTFSYYYLLSAGLISGVFLARYIIVNLVAGALYSLFGKVSKNELIEVQGQIGYFLTKDWYSFTVLIASERKQYPNRLLLLPDFYHLNHEDIKQVSFEIDIPSQLSLDAARLLLNRFLQATPYVVGYEEESYVKSIKPGYSYHLQLSVSTYESYVWSVCEQLHSQVGQVLEEATNAQDQTRYNLQIK